jgi:hypothetical protein
MTQRPSRFGPAWLLLPVAFLALYLVSFTGFPVIERAVSVVGEADAASYSILYREFELDTPIGNPFNLDGRSLADVAQKHKLHHVVSAAAGHGIYVAAAPVYRLLGMPDGWAVYLPGALVGALNIVLLALLLRGDNPHGNSVVPFVVLYGVSLSPWLYAAVPDSWPLTTALFLGFLVLARNERIPMFSLAALLGLFMLNNMAIAALVGVLWLREWRSAPVGVRLLARSAGALVVVLATWLAGLTGLSFFDPGFRPDHYWAFSRWFRDYMGATLPLTDPYVWKSVISNLLVNGVTTNQPDPNMPQEAMMATLRSSRLGAAAIVALAGLLLAATIRLVRYALAAAREAGLRTALTDPAVFPALWCLVMIVVTVAIYYGGGFTYAALTTPMLAALLCRHLDLRRPVERVLVWAAVAVIVINNLDQVRQFRAALDRMS